MVNTKNKFKFKYGYVETRAWVPECGGCWPSFWIMPATDDHWPPEIDIFEYFQFASYTRSFPHSVFHYKPDGDLGPYPFEHHTSETDDVPSPKPQEWMVTHPAGDDGNYYNGWHTYRMHWTPDYVDLQVDRNPALRFSGASKIPQEPMYLIYMMAICDIDGTVCTADKSVPAAGNSMKIDYLRVYSDNT
jgi:beta-glucanase (GH16 family)